MTLELYNTLSRRKEIFVPLDKKTAKIYSCGPTVYSTATIGNLRAYIFTDVLKKTIEAAGFDVYDVMNTTDVGHLASDDDEGEDKVENAARKQGTTPQAIAARYTEQFFRDCELLNIRRPKRVAPATKYITDMIEFVKALEAKGLTYITSDGVYFDSSRFPNYYKLAGGSKDGNRAGARVDLGEKRGNHDFALWKFVGENTLQKWASPWKPGKAQGQVWGCPGWHIECSAIARKELGETFDIHTGGIDHIPIHHTNEIAQTESLTGKKMCNFWLHNEFILIDGGKMSKSLGNTYTLADLSARGFSPMAYRCFCLMASYRSILNFTWQGLEAAQKAYNNLVMQLAKHRASPKRSTINPEAFYGALFDDLNTPRAIAVIWDMLKQPPSKDIYLAVIGFDKVLSLGLEKAVADFVQNKKTSAPAEVIEMAEKRKTAKAARDFAAADLLRKQIEEAGYQIRDTKDGGYALDSMQC